MNGVQFAERVHIMTGQSAATFPLADMAKFANLAKDELAQRLEAVNEGYFTMEYLHDLIEGQRFYRLPYDMMNRMEKLEIYFPGWETYRRATEDRLSMNKSTTDEAVIKERYNDLHPQFWLRRDGIFILTGSDIPDSPDGIKLWAKTYPSDISAATLAQKFDLSVMPMDDAVGMPREAHFVWAIRTSMLYKTNQDRQIALTEMEQNFEYHFQQALKAINGQNIERSVTPSMPRNDGSQY